MRNILILIVLAISTGAFGAIPFDIPNNEIKLGDGDALSAKSIELKMGLGASNPIFSSSDGTEMVVNIPFRTQGDLKADGLNLDIGDGTNSEQFMSFNIAGEKVGFKFDPVSGEVLQKKKAGDAYKKLGTGSGSASTGINAFGEDDNANAEDGTLAWSNTGGTFTTTAVVADVIAGEQSFVFTPSAQNNVVTGPTLNFDLKKYYGITCELGIEYYGGDENLELHIVDGNGAILNEDLPNNRKIPARANTRGPFSVSFQCPKEADILGDANKGNLHVEIKNVGAVAAPAITWDLTYVGDDRNLGTSVLPDIASASFNTVDGIIISQNNDLLVGNCTGGISGVKDCVFKDDYTIIPTCTATVTNASTGFKATIDTLTTNGFTIRTFSTGNTISAAQVSVRCERQGIDAQRTVETYKAIPVTSETVNSFTADIDGALTITNETPEFITSCVSNGTGDKTCTFNAGLFTNAPTVQITMFDGNGNCREARTSDISTTSFRYQTLSSGGVVTDCRVSVEVNRTLTDYKSPQTKNLSLAGIAVNSYAEQNQAQVRVESCYITNAGTPTTASNLCDSWIDSITDNGVGNPVVNFKTNIFSQFPNCTCVTRINATPNCVVNTSGPTSIGIFTSNNSASVSDVDLFLICQGVK